MIKFLCLLDVAISLCLCGLMLDCIVPQISTHPCVGVAGRTVTVVRRGWVPAPAPAQPRCPTDSPDPGPDQHHIITIITQTSQRRSRLSGQKTRLNQATLPPSVDACCLLEQSAHPRTADGAAGLRVEIVSNQMIMIYILASSPGNQQLQLYCCEA